MPRRALPALLLSLIVLCGCGGLAVHDTSSLLVPRFQRSEVLGFVAGFGTTFAAVPDVIAMLRRRSSKGMNPMMAGIMGGDRVEHRRGRRQFLERRRVPSFRPEREAASAS